VCERTPAVPVVELHPACWRLGYPESLHADLDLRGLLELAGDLRLRLHPERVEALAGTWFEGAHAVRLPAPGEDRYFLVAPGSTASLGPYMEPGGHTELMRRERHRPTDRT
jgi:hypothetical protein